MQAVASPLQSLCCQTARTISHSQRGRVLYLYPLWGVRRRGGKKSNRTGRMLLLPSRLVGASSQMWFVWQAGVRGSQKRAGRIFREAEMISFDCFLQHFLRLQPYSCGFPQIKTQFEAPLPEAGLHFAQMVIDSEAHARWPGESFENRHYLPDGAI